MTGSKQLINSINYASATLKISSTLLPMVFILLVIHGFTILHALFVTAIPLLSNIFYWLEVYTNSLDYTDTPKHIYVADRINNLILKFNIPRLYLADVHRTLNIFTISLFLFFECQDIAYIVVAVILSVGNIYSIIYKRVSLDDIDKQIKTSIEMRLKGSAAKSTNQI